MRTPLTYYGGKQRLARRIVALMPAHRSYLEPFAGGAAVLFAKPRVERETLNDLDGMIVQFWRAVRDQREDLATAVAATPYGREEWEIAREILSRGEDLGDVDAARLLLLHIDQSFSRARSGWSPPSIDFERRGRWQPGVWQNMPDKIVAAATRLQGVALEHGDALELIPRWDHDDALIYIDPPYAGEHRLDPSKGYTCDDHDGTLWPRLVDVLLTIRRATVFLSGYPCAEAERLEWDRLDLTVKRTTARSAGDKLEDAPEVLWSNRPIASQGSLLGDLEAVA